MSSAPLRFVRCDDPTLTAAEAGRALRAWVERSWLRSRRHARELTVAEAVTPGAYHVRLETLVETRWVRDAVRPYRGGELDGPEGGEPPGKWDAEVMAPELFADRSVVGTLPHTESVHRCDSCGGDGRVVCGTCRGHGEIDCTWCSGRGRRSTFKSVDDGNGGSTTKWVDEDCSSCMGGQVTCGGCGGGRTVECSTCDGRGRVVRYVELNVEWKVRRDARIIERTAMPDELVLDAEPVDHVSLEATAIEPVVDMGDAFRGAPPRVSAEVNPLINELLEEHRPGADARHLRQRLHVGGVPVYEVRYRDRERERSLWIYGADRRVHAPGFPLDRWRTAGLALAGLASLAATIFLVVR